LVESGLKLKDDRCRAIDVAASTPDILPPTTTTFPCLTGDVSSKREISFALGSSELWTILATPSSPGISGVCGVPKCPEATTRKSKLSVLISGSLEAPAEEHPFSLQLD
jgi:hypothetical protein